MKKIFVFCLTVVIALSANAQKLNPVKWTFEAVKKSDKQYDLIFTANVEAPWHIYSQFVKKGPVPTSILFKKNALVIYGMAIKKCGLHGRSSVEQCFHFTVQFIDKGLRVC